jgi:hypothetical protein
MASTSNGTVKLAASARFGFGGKQFIARIVGRDPKFTFDREFLGKKIGKRGEDTTVTVDEPGLYQERDIDSKGRHTDTYYVVFTDPAVGVDYIDVSHDDAMKLAKLSTSEIDAEGQRLEAARLERVNAEAAAKDPEELIESKVAGLEGTHPRRAIMAARAKRVAMLRGEPVVTAEQAEYVEKVAEPSTRAEIEAHIADLERRLDIARAQLAALPAEG